MGEDLAVFGCKVEGCKGRGFHEHARYLKSKVKSRKLADVETGFGKLQNISEAQMFLDDVSAKAPLILQRALGHVVLQVIGL